MGCCKGPASADRSDGKCCRHDSAAKLYDRESRCCRDGWSGGNLGNAHGGVWIQRGGLDEVLHAVLERGANCPELVNYGAEQAGVSENAVGWL